jgi:glycosyltransferase involved in cell wall biosynthesis
MPHHIVIDARIRRSTTGRYTDRLVERLQDIDHTNRYTILVQPDDPWRMHAANFATLPCPFAQFSLNPLDQLRFAWQLYRLKPDLVHFTMTQQPLLYFGTIVTTTHDLTMFRFVRRGNISVPAYRVKMGLYRFLVQWSHYKSSRIIVPTHTVQTEVGAFQPSTKPKLVVTYESSEPVMAIAASQPTGISEPFLLYVGTAFPHKNLPKMIEAFDILHAQHKGLRLVITGRRTEKHLVELIDWAKDHPSFSNIVFPGFVSDAELRWLYEHCSAYVFTSLSEGFGLPPLEAMAHGAPVASSNASCMPEVYGDAAHYFDPLDAMDIATTVADILDNHRLADTLRAAGKKQVGKYSWQKMAQETLDVYQGVLAHRQ